MVTITCSVGDNGINKSFDVRNVQKLLNQNLHLLPGIKKLSEDGRVGKLTNAAILSYQKNILKMFNPDSRVDPFGRTIKSLNKTAKVSRPANVTAFITKTLSAAKSVKTNYQVPVSIVIAQAALESGWGRHVKDNAYFGIKAHRTKGATTAFTTTEFVNGKKVTIKDSFRAYADFAESAEDYGKFLKANPRYKIAFNYSNDPYRFAEQLQAAGYATDPLYANKLKSIISKYKLDEYE